MDMMRDCSQLEELDLSTRIEAGERRTVDVYEERMAFTAIVIFCLSER